MLPAVDMLDGEEERDVPRLWPAAPPQPLHDEAQCHDSPPDEGQCHDSLEHVVGPTGTNGFDEEADAKLITDWDVPVANDCTEPMSLESSMSDGG